MRFDMLFKQHSRVGVLAALLALSACKQPPAPAVAEQIPDETAPAVSAGQQARAVTVVEVEMRELAGALSASGDLVPRQEAAVLGEVSGYPVAAVLADVGDRVRKGQVLVRLDSALLDSQVAQAEAQAEQAAAQAELSEDQATRVDGLDDQGVLAPEAIMQRRIQARSARATARAQTEALRNLRVRLAKLQVTAPVDGLVLEKTVRPGDLSGSGTTPWFRLASGSQIELQAQLADRDLSRVRVGQTAQVRLAGGQVLAGTVRLVSPQIDPQTKLGTVRVTLPVRDDVRAGGFASAEFADASGSVASVPETTVRYDADGASVMVVGADNRVKRIAVRTGNRGSGLVQLIDGPPPGTAVVRSAGSFLLDGDRVQITQGAP